MNWVFDASISGAWCFEDEKTDRTEALLDRLVGGDPAAVPSLWATEIANVLALAVRKKRLSSAKRTQFTQLLLACPIHLEPVSTALIFRDVMPLADHYGLTVYDASYLELAQRLALPLATLDIPLMKAAKAAGVPLL